MGFTPAANAARFTPIATIPVPGAASAAPNPAYAGIFIPQIWSSKLVDKFYDATVLAAIANTDYQGEIQKYGDTVKIRTRPDVTIADYVPDQALAVTRPSSNLVSLNIDQAHYFNTILDDIYKVQSDIDLMNQWSIDASERMKIRVDTNVLASMPLAAHADNVGATAGRISNDINIGAALAPVPVVSRGAVLPKRDILDYILDLAQVLDEQNVPETGRFLIVPSWATSMLKKSELRDASLTGDGVSPLRNGRIGMIDRFTIYASNLMPTTGNANEYYIFAGTKSALTFAAQMTEMETLRAESTFGTLMRGLMVYGFDPIKTEALAVGVVSKG
jgi:hypothetical protein